MWKNEEAEKSIVFVRHIKNHLKKEKIPGKVMCKICNKDIDEINNMEYCFLDDEDND